MPTIEQTSRPTRDEVLAQVGPPAPTGVRRLRRAVPLFVVGGLVVLLAVWQLVKPKAQPMEWLSTAVKQGDLAATVSATGTLRGKSTVEVGAETSGRVKVVNVDFNDAVTTGQVLAEIDPASTKAALQQANAQLAAARAAVKNAEATALEAKLQAERTRGLAADGLSSKQALESANAAAARAEASAEQAKAQVVVSQAAVDANATALAKTQVRSPIDGVVLSRDVEVGQTLVAAMSTPVVFTLAKDLREMEVTIGIDEADVGRTEVGQRATFTVDAWPGRTFQGELTSIHNVAVTKDNVVTYEARLRVDNDGLKLRPGMTATVSIATEEVKGVLLVPNAALRFSPPAQGGRSMLDGPPGEGPRRDDDGSPKVWVLREGTPRAVKVETGLTDGTSTEVRSAELKAGDLVVTDAQQKKVTR